jgi:hypothetical protein
MIALQVGGTAHDYVRVEALGQDDEGWIHVRVEIMVGAFSGAFRATFDTGAFVRFAAELRVLYGALRSVATFSTLEGQLELIFEGDGRGHVEVRGEAVDVAGTGNRLGFRLRIDQTYVPRILQDVETVLAKYPARVA